ncbi:CrcB protein homolog [Streptomyces sp. NBRC 110611]|uniref:fluoride efflux transporter CrcB n=1 Tax=Streptomyces sp. NBRC 110611 TaxID=1621259 RepID=UPI0008377F68|nr:fluoride efflux transporter CrcB [Streptomyces sp. NBRC 110611]GAU65406.1 CrcB protein homolog [Streptomyces sp. NBRC 110611]
MNERARRARPWQGQWPVIGAVSAGGAVGAAARYGASLLWPAGPGAFPWTTLAVNAAGCALMGVLMVLITEVRSAHRLLRPFLGTGVLGGFTTFSTYAVDVQRLVGDRQPLLALAYLAGTVLAALAAVWLGAAGTRALLVPGQRTG